MIGSAFLITPCVEQNADQVTGYFPADNWYNYEYENTQYLSQTFMLEENSQGETQTLSSPSDHINIHVRGGHIVPTQERANTTHYARMNPFGLIVAPNSQGEAEGDLFYDDGISDNYDSEHFYATFSLRDNRLKMNIEQNTYEGMKALTLNKIRIFVNTPDAANLKFVLNKQVILDEDKNKYKIDRLRIKGDLYHVLITGLDLPMDKEFELQWTAEMPQLASGQIKTLIDCSMQNMPLNETACQAKSCQYHKPQEAGTPSCFVPTGKGGYTMTEKKPGEFTLKKADNFQLIENSKSIENLTVLVKYGIIDGQYRMANLKVSLEVSTKRIKFLASQLCIDWYRSWIRTIQIATKSQCH